MKNLLIIYLLLAFCSCEKDYNKVIEIDFPYSTNVICLMTDDEEFTEVSLRRIFKLGEPATYISHYYAEAKVSISDGINNYTLNYDSALEVFNIDSGLFKVAKGKSYTLKIVLVDGSMITSTCTAPIETIPNYSYLCTDISDHQFSYSINWDNDSPNEKYYVTQLYVYFQNSVNSYYRRSYKAIAYRKPVNQSAVSLNGYGKSTVFDHNIAQYIYPTLYYTNQETYLYYDAAIKNVQGDPGGTPSVVPSNIQGGTGVFGPLISQ